VALSLGGVYPDRTVRKRLGDSLDGHAVNEDAVAQLAKEYARLSPQLNERERRLWADRHAKALEFDWPGHNGTTDQTSSPPRTVLARCTK
jgi:hypothetical protein